MKKYNKYDDITIQARVSKNYKDRIINKSREYGITFSDMLFSAFDEQLLRKSIKTYNFAKKRNDKISLTVTNSFKERINNYCNKYKISKTDFVISALENYIDRRNNFNVSNK